jgi:chaperonin GroES
MADLQFPIIEDNNSPIPPVPHDEAVQQEQEAKRRELAQVVENLKAVLDARFAMVNIADTLPNEVLDKIGQRVIEDYKTDRRSRSAWEKANEEILELAKLEVKKKTYNGEVVSNIKYPLITNAAIQFSARTYPEIVKGSDVVKPKVIGEDPDGKKVERGKRLCSHMSYMLLNDIPDWEEGVDQLLFTLPVVGCAFKKTYRDARIDKNISEMVFPDDLVVHYYAKSLEKAARITQKIELTKNEIVERIRSGIFVDFDVDELGLAQRTDDNTDDQGQIDEDTPHVFLEQHRWYDLDEDGYQEPYIVTVIESNEKVVRICARYGIDGVEYNEKNEVVRIEPVHYFTRFLFMPSPDGSFYGMGLGSLLHSINSGSNAILNQLIDAGKLANRQCGFLGRGIQLGRGSSLKLKSGEWKPVQNTGDDLRKNIVPIPAKEPSPTLFQLLGLLIESGKELAGVTDVLAGENPGANVPAATTLALIEQGLKVYAAIQKRVHRSLYKEYDKIRKLNFMYLDEYKYSMILDSKNAIGRKDYNPSDFDIIPVSDPSSTTDMQRIMKATALLEMKGQGLNDDEINRRYLEALRVDNIDLLIPKEKPPNPMLELEMQEKQANIASKNAEAQKFIAEIQREAEKAIAEINRQKAESERIMADIQLIIEKARTQRVTQEVKLQGTDFDRVKLDIEKAQTISNIKNLEEQSKRETAKIINDIRSNSKAEGKSSETKTQGPYRERGVKSNNEE